MRIVGDNSPHIQTGKNSGKWNDILEGNLKLVGINNKKEGTDSKKHMLIKMIEKIGG